MRIMLIDNHDSFVYNIVGLFEKIRQSGHIADLEWDVRMNDDIDIDEVSGYDAMVLSPGPGIPREAGKLMELLKRHAERMPVFGICLGFQAIAEHFGGRLSQLASPRHGHPSHLCRIDGDDPVMGALAGTRPMVGRYHSWIVDEASLPPELVATSYDEEGNLMSLRHKRLKVFGTQFHPESIISDCGLQIIESFLLTVNDRDRQP